VTDEVPLGGGTTEGVVRVGRTVRRPRTSRSAWVERLLVHLEQVGAEVAPRFLGIDERGRQIRELVDGASPPGPPFHLSDAAQRSAMRLLRRFHDATVGTEWAAGSEVVCHGDLGPHNTIFRGDEAVRLVDWDDDVAPGRRAVDVADAVWGFADLTSREVPVQEQARRLSMCCRAYGDVEPDVVMAELLEQFRRARGNHLAAGRDRPRRVFDALIAWTEAHRQSLTCAGPGGGPGRGSGET
jgi:Ser/Thr protein kinase RdoA (MazF antagonist)